MREDVESDKGHDLQVQRRYLYGKNLETLAFSSMTGAKAGWEGGERRSGATVEETRQWDGLFLLRWILMGGCLGVAIAGSGLCVRALQWAGWVGSGREESM